MLQVSRNATTHSTHLDEFNIIKNLCADEKLLLDLANRERVKSGLPVFFVDFRLVELARLKSEDLFSNHYFSHISPTHGTAYDMKKRKGITARVMGGENIAKAASSKRVHELFMNSQEHRDNILSDLHDTIGIGVHRTRYGVVVTQLFTGH